MLYRKVNNYFNSEVLKIQKLTLPHIKNSPRNHRSRMTNHSRECCRARCCPSHYRTTPHKSTLPASNPKVT